MLTSFLFVIIDINHAACVDACPRALISRSLQLHAASIHHQQKQKIVANDGGATDEEEGTSLPRRPSSVVAEEGRRCRQLWGGGKEGGGEAHSGAFRSSSIPQQPYF